MFRSKIIFALPAVTLLVTAAILSYSEGTNLTGVMERKDDQRLTIESLRCFETLNYGEDRVVMRIATPGRDTLELRKGMERAMNRRQWNIDEVFFFHRDSAVSVFVMVENPKKKMDTLGVLRLGQVPANVACNAAHPIRNDKFSYSLSYKLEGTEAKDGGKPLFSKGNDACGRI